MANRLFGLLLKKEDVSFVRATKVRSDFVKEVLTDEVLGALKKGEGLFISKDVWAQFNKREDGTVAPSVMMNGPVGVLRTKAMTDKRGLSFKVVRGENKQKEAGWYITLQ